MSVFSISNNSAIKISLNHRISQFIAVFFYFSTRTLLQHNSNINDSGNNNNYKTILNWLENFYY